MTLGISPFSSVGYILSVSYRLKSGSIFEQKTCFCEIAQIKLYAISNNPAI